MKDSVTKKHELVGITSWVLSVEQKNVGYFGRKLLVISFYHHISFLSDASPIIAFTLSLAHLTMLLPTPIDILEILKSKNSFRFMFILSSPRAKPAESARAFTGRRNSHSERGEDFLTGQLNFFTETAVTPERKVEKWFPRWEINRHVKG